jgi:hypothetical protein
MVSSHAEIDEDDDAPPELRALLPGQALLMTRAQSDHASAAAPEPSAADDAAFARAHGMKLSTPESYEGVVLPHEYAVRAGLAQPYAAARGTPVTPSGPPKTPTVRAVVEDGYQHLLPANTSASKAPPRSSQTVAAKAPPTPSVGSVQQAAAAASLVESNSAASVGVGPRTQSVSVVYRPSKAAQALEVEMDLEYDVTGGGSSDPAALLAAPSQTGSYINVGLGVLSASTAPVSTGYVNVVLPAPAGSAAATDSSQVGEQPLRYENVRSGKDPKTGYVNVTLPTSTAGSTAVAAQLGEQPLRYENVTPGQGSNTAAATGASSAAGKPRYENVTTGAEAARKEDYVNVTTGVADESGVAASGGSVKSKTSYVNVDLQGRSLVPSAEEGMAGAAARAANEANYRTYKHRKGRERTDSEGAESQGSESDSEQPLSGTEARLANEKKYRTYKGAKGGQGGGALAQELNEQLAGSAERSQSEASARSSSGMDQRGYTRMDHGGTGGPAMVAVQQQSLYDSVDSEPAPSRPTRPPASSAARPAAKASAPPPPPLPHAVQDDLYVGIGDEEIYEGIGDDGPAASRDATADSEC